MFGDGNCFFRALSVSMYGNQNEYGALRAGVARFISTQSQSAALTPYDRDALRQRAAYISSNGTWAAEDIILATANNLQLAIHVCFAASGTSPMIYSPSLSKPSLSPLMLAYFEPGHYCSVAPLRVESLYDGSCGGAGHYKAALSPYDSRKGRIESDYISKSTTRLQQLTPSDSSLKSRKEVSPVRASGTLNC